MRVCVPTMGNKGMDEQVSEHFGRAPTFTIMDTVTNKVTVVENTSEHMGGTGKPPELLAREGVQTMLAGGMGAKAMIMFEDNGIMVFSGAQGTVRETLALWKGGKLTPATREGACKEHRH